MRQQPDGLHRPLPTDAGSNVDRKYVARGYSRSPGPGRHLLLCLHRQWCLHGRPHLREDTLETQYGSHHCTRSQAPLKPKRTLPCLLLKAEVGYLTLYVKATQWTSVWSYFFTEGEVIQYWRGEISFFRSSWFSVGICRSTLTHDLLNTK